MPSQFAETEDLHTLAIPDGDVRYRPRLALHESPEDILRKLISETPWRSEEITIFGRRYRQPRLTAWYGDAEARYRYSGLELEPLPWTELLSRVRRSVEDAAGCPVNSVLLNFYRDHRDSMGLHSDDEPELGPEPVIVSLSLGATRTFTLKHRRRRDFEPVRILLGSGSLLLMSGPTQANWKHGISKQTRPCGPRVNLTFRRILSGQRSRAESISIAETLGT